MKNSKRAGLALGVGALVVLALGPALAIAAGDAVSIVEQDDQYKFQPADLSVAEGTTLRWTNNSDAPHTVTADDGKAFASDQLAENDTWEETFDTAGTYAYHCRIHDYMHGTVTVLAAGATPPPTDAAPAQGSPAGGVPWLPLLAAAAAVIVLGGLGQRALVARERS